MTVIRVESLSKQYRLGLIGGGTLRADLSRWWAMKRGKEDPLAGIGESEDKAKLGERFWALRDVSFEVKQGEVLGIIGRNGAGKSTLLKILSRVTSPTEGSVKVKGRIGSLLEVGTGFHGELTGRENTYLNGAILGMTRREVTRKLDEIVAFAEMDKFIDTPVKRYSSGMYVRLAFAVAAHLDPEILIVDEVLAVGDAAFQKKCLGKMGEVSREGRTVLFVSHNMGAVGILCSRAMLLNDGATVCSSSPPRGAIAEYAGTHWDHGAKTAWCASEDGVKDRRFTARALRLVDNDGLPAGAVQAPGAEMWVEIDCEVQQPEPLLQVGYVLRGQNGDAIYCSYHTDMHSTDLAQLEPGAWRLRSPVPSGILNIGSYTAHLSVSIHCREWIARGDGPDAYVAFRVDGRFSNSQYWLGRREGLLAPTIPWTAVRLA